MRTIVTDFILNDLSWLVEVAINLHSAIVQLLLKCTCILAVMVK